MGLSKVATDVKRRRTRAPRHPGRLRACVRRREVPGDPQGTGRPDSHTRQYDAYNRVPPDTGQPLRAADPAAPGTNLWAVLGEEPGSDDYSSRCAKPTERSPVGSRSWLAVSVMTARLGSCSGWPGTASSTQSSSDWTVRSRGATSTT